MPAIFYLNPLGLMPREIRSDTMVSAIIWSIAEMGKDPAPLIRDRSLRVSSVMPLLRTSDGERILFLPKPRIPPPMLGGIEKIRKAKLYKKVSYLQVQIFRKLIEGETSIGDIVECIGREYAVRGSLLMEKHLTKSDFSLTSWNRVRNTLNRILGRSESFFTSQGTFYWNAGLFFIMEGSDPWISAAISALRFLQDRGIGGEISIGQGRFNLERFEREASEDINAIVRSSGNQNEGDPDTDDYSAVLLSLYLPTPEEWSAICTRKEHLYYSLCWRAGRRRSDLKKRVLLLEEGSVIPITNIKGTHEVVATKPLAVEWGCPLLSIMKIGGVL